MTGKSRYHTFLPGHLGRTFELTLESGEPLIVTIGDDNTIMAAFPDRRRTYRHTIPAEEGEITTLAGQPGFTVAHSLPGVLVLSVPDHGPAYVWHLEDAESSQWVRP